MEIIYHGHTCFEIRSGDQKILLDPYDKKIGKLSKADASIVVMTGAHASLEQIDGTPRVIDWPGEYEVAGVYFMGIANKYDGEQVDDVEATMFVMIIEGMRVGYLGSIKHKLDAKYLEKLGNIDILILPVGGSDTIDAKTAKSITESIDPRVVIPMSYHQEGISVTGLATLDEFAKEMGEDSYETEKSFKATKSSLPADAMKFVVLAKK